ncbi:general transcription factor II-I repeat domain-containing protein 2-like isoform X1 [Felis catus]|nr:general transcription factor II-I repeat domain-containing protein 2-like isoform X1 [Felis catus]XP_044890546.1 general transcription factor II-I repeat domain-containing protein 2-like isoform X1 [Felis catus]XP_044890547.1 general transcription factor II-I repeat domain-containing protein 2-like isoform X1 [Felis catus]
MSFFPKEIEYGEDEMSDDGSRDEAVIPQKNGGKVTTAPENKVGGETSPAPVVAEKLTSPHRKTATWAKLPKDRRSGNDEEEEDKNTELGQDEKEPIKKTPDKWKKEMAKQKASPEIKKQRLEARNTKTLLIKDLPDKVTQRELKEVFKDAFQIRLVSKDGMNKRIAYADFKSQADAKRALEDKQGTKIGGLAVALDPVGEKSQGQEERGWKNSTRRMGKRKLEQESHTFQEKWERAYFFVEVKNVPTCLICKQSVSVSKEYHLRHHYETNHSRNHEGYTEKMRDKKLNELKKRLKFQHDVLLNVNKISDAAMKCSYVLSEKIARASKPFTDGEFIKECLLSAAEIMCPEQRHAFANIRLSANIVPQHVGDVAGNLQDKLRGKGKSFVAFSIAAHEGADVDNAPQLAVFIRGVDETFDVTEELLDMVPMTGTSSGNELFVCVEESLKKFNVDWSKLVSVSTDGNSAQVGVEQLVTELKSKVSGLCKDTELKSVHGLILQESLCTKKLKMDHVMDIVIHTITWIRSHGSDHREFSALFSELDAQYGSLFSVGLKWLSRGMVLRRFFELLEEIDFFMSSKGKPVPQLTSKDWVKDLAFLVDIMTYLNMLDISLQRRSQVVTQMYDSIHSFLMKLCLWETHLARNNLAHFPTLKLVSENEKDGLNYIPRIKELKTEFQKRFSDFKLYESELTLFSSPFSVNINNVSEELQMEVIELQCNTILKTKYDCVGIPEFYKHLGNGYPKYKNHCAKILSMFGSTYVCEQLFSVMKQQKTTKYCPQLKDSGVTSLRHVAAPDTHPGVE